MKDLTLSVAAEVADATTTTASVAPPTVTGSSAASAKADTLSAPVAARRKRAAGATADRQREDTIEDIYKAYQDVIKRAGGDGGSDEDMVDLLLEAQDTRPEKAEAAAAAAEKVKALREEMQQLIDRFLNEVVIPAEGVVSGFHGKTFSEIISMKEEDVPLRDRFLQRFLIGQSILRMIAEREAMKGTGSPTSKRKDRAQTARSFITWTGKTGGTLRFHTLPNLDSNQCFVPTEKLVTPAVKLKLTLTGLADEQVAVNNDLRMLNLFKESQAGALKRALEKVGALFKRGVSDCIQSIVSRGDGDVAKVSFHVEAEVDQEEKLLHLTIKVVPPRGSLQCVQELNDGANREQLVTALINIAEAGAEAGPGVVGRVSMDEREGWPSAMTSPGMPKRVSELSKGMRLLGPDGEATVADIKRRGKIARVMVALKFVGLDKVLNVTQDHPIEYRDDQGRMWVCSAQEVAVDFNARTTTSTYSLVACDGSQATQRQIEAVTTSIVHMEVREVRFEDDKTAFVDLSEDPKDTSGGKKDNSGALRMIAVKGEMMRDDPDDSVEFTLRSKTSAGRGEEQQPAESHEPRSRRGGRGKHASKTALKTTQARPRSPGGPAPQVTQSAMS